VSYRVGSINGSINFNNGFFSRDVCLT